MSCSLLGISPILLQAGRSGQWNMRDQELWRANRYSIDFCCITRPPDKVRNISHFPNKFTLTQDSCRGLDGLALTCETSIGPPQPEHPPITPIGSQVVVGHLWPPVKSGWQWVYCGRGVQVRIVDQFEVFHAHSDFSHLR
jgi:hypothetical protein